jgi:DNA-binding Lrp family transcriptional regulator
MIRHVVMFRWADDVDEAHIDRVAAALDGLPEVIPEIARYAHGSDLALADGNHDYAVVGDFESVDAYEAYRDHPVHQAFIADLIAGRIAERAAVQFQC